MNVIYDRTELVNNTLYTANKELVEGPGDCFVLLLLFGT